MQQNKAQRKYIYKKQKIGNEYESSTGCAIEIDGFSLTSFLTSENQ